MPFPFRSKSTWVTRLPSIFLQKPSGHPEGAHHFYEDLLATQNVSPTSAKTSSVAEFTLSRIANAPSVAKFTFSGIANASSAAQEASCNQHVPLLTLGFG